MFPTLKGFRIPPDKNPLKDKKNLKNKYENYAKYKIIAKKMQRNNR